MKTALIILLGMLLLGCSHFPGKGSTTPKEVAESLIGKHQDELLMKLGNPNQDIALSNGKHVWIYDKDTESSTGGIGIGGGRGSAGIGIGRGHSKIEGCKRTFIMSKGIAESVEMEGKPCRTKIPRWEATTTTKAE